MWYCHLKDSVTFKTRLFLSLSDCSQHSQPNVASTRSKDIFYIKKTVKELFFLYILCNEASSPHPPKTLKSRKSPSAGTRYIIKQEGRRKTRYSTLKETNEQGSSEKQVLDSLEHAHSPIHLQFNCSKQPSRSQLYYNYFTFWKVFGWFFFPPILSHISK